MDAIIPFGTTSFEDVNEVIALFSGCTRLRSLHITAEVTIIFQLLEKIRSATHIHSLSLDIEDQWLPVRLQDDLLGGQAPIREMFFVSERYIIAPQ
jgi:hypothetical protein